MSMLFCQLLLLSCTLIIASGDLPFQQSFGGNRANRAGSFLQVLAPQGGMGQAVARTDIGSQLDSMTQGGLPKYNDPFLPYQSPADSTNAYNNIQPVDSIDACVHIPRPSFCSNVDWPVPDGEIVQAIRSNADLQIALMYVNFQGTRQCKLWYRDIMCRYSYPKCGFGPPCRSECLAFTRDCPWAGQACNAFPDVNCDKAASPAYAVGEDGFHEATLARTGGVPAELQNGAASVSPSASLFFLLLMLVVVLSLLSLTL